MTKASRVLLKACKQLRHALLEADWLREDCEMVGEPLTQEMFDDEVFSYGGNEAKARRQLAKNYNINLKRLLKELSALGKAVNAVLLALPATAEERIASIDHFEYRGDDEPGE